MVPLNRANKFPLPCVKGLAFAHLHEKGQDNFSILFDSATHFASSPKSTKQIRLEASPNHIRELANMATAKALRHQVETLKLAERDLRCHIKALGNGKTETTYIARRCLLEALEGIRLDRAAIERRVDVLLGVTTKLLDPASALAEAAKLQSPWHPHHSKLDGTQITAPLF